MTLRFPGQQYDAESGLHYNYLRDYEPDTGRYVESDPLGLRGGLAIYQYALASPLIWKDAQGGIASDWFDTLCSVDQSCLPVPTWPDWGPPTCDYYDDQCKKCDSDTYACNARKCCESFGDSPATNCTRRCLIKDDTTCSGLPPTNEARVERSLTSRATQCAAMLPIFSAPLGIRQNAKVL
jgi:RHS repeat-associated protein